MEVFFHWSKLDVSGDLSGSEEKNEAMWSDRLFIWTRDGGEGVAVNSEGTKDRSG